MKRLDYTWRCAYDSADGLAVRHAADRCRFGRVERARTTGQELQTWDITA
ncbi:MAG: hypothetical protein H8E62_08515 [Planctomycetes bacterium]|nr:hypothetical protein [Planctomycetota bacterium]